ncbi:glycoside hydrolase family 6 protein [Erwinia sp. 9145]|uniref:glycoside hydrolase family 6 protein n=1 Tax=Erwinia sp. 9145 TaxID=1500895 RepID=UPI001E4D7690|nr:glycoside hydrolase family 6 protein [Erwinia sp. 9145]
MNLTLNRLNMKNKIFLSVIASLISSNAFSATVYYTNPDSTAATWVKNNAADSRTATIKNAIADKPMARWFTGTSQSTDDLTSKITSYTTAAKNASATPLLVAYNIPGRDCSGGASSGGAASATAYKKWIDNFIAGIGSRAAVVILEPDAIADADCLTSDKRDERFSLLNYAATAFSTKAPAAQVYIDAGNPAWLNAAKAGEYLNRAGVKKVKGFALNVSNFYTTAQNTTYGNNINSFLSSSYGFTKSFLIDTSRNGNGANPGDWCNPPGRKIGTVTQALTANIMAAWVKVPGNSDGASSPTADCHGGPAAGTFSPGLATKLINGN